MACSIPGLLVLHYLLEFAQVHVHWVGDTIQPSYPQLPSSPAFNLSQHQVFSNESALYIRQPKYWSFSFSISPSNEYSQSWFPLELTGLIFLLSKGTLKSLLQHHNSKASILQGSVFFFYSLTLTLYLSLEFSNSGYAVISTNLFFFKERNDKKWVGYLPCAIPDPFSSFPCPALALGS